MMLREAKKFFDSPLMSSVRDLRVYDHALLAALGRRRRRLGRRAFRLSRLLGRLPLRFLIIQKTATRRRHRRLLKGKAKRRQTIEMTQRNRQTHTRTRAHAYIALGTRQQRAPTCGTKKFWAGGAAGAAGVAAAGVGGMPPPAPTAGPAGVPPLRTSVYLARDRPPGAQGKDKFKGVIWGRGGRANTRVGVETGARTTTAYNHTAATTPRVSASTDRPYLGTPSIGSCQAGQSAGCR